MEDKVAVRSKDNLKSGLIDLVFKEAKAMAEYALTNGLQVPPTVISLLEQFSEHLSKRNNGGAAGDTMPIDALVGAHSTLSRIINPAKPQTIVLLTEEKRNSGILRFLGPVSLIRQLMVVALICLVCFVSLVLSNYVNAGSDAGNILGSSGMPLFMNLMFYLSAAGMGATFSALYKANYYITQGTFDPTYHASYWIRFILGLIAGLLLAVIISNKAFEPAQLDKSLLQPGIVRPLLAILGGFSADVAYTILNRLVETLESLFRGSSKDIVNNQVRDEKGKLALAQTQQQMKMVTELVSLQQQLSSDGNTEQATAVSNMLKELVPYSEFSNLQPGNVKKAAS